MTGAGDVCQPSRMQNVVPIHENIRLPQDPLQAALRDATLAASHILRAAMNADDDDAAHLATDIIRLVTEFEDE